MLAEVSQSWAEREMPRSECGHYSGDEVDRMTVTTGINEEIQAKQLSFILLILTSYLQI